MFKKLWQGWKRFGFFMAKLFGYLLFAILYVVVFAPVALVAKLRGRQFLPHFDKSAPTYFLPRDKIEATLEYLRRQW
jgi:hypothetical protein